MQHHIPFDAPDLAAIVLGAGRGTRMGGDLPKILHPVAGKPMIEHVLSSLSQVPISSYCLVLQDDLSPFANFLHAFPDVTVCSQKERNGTGGAASVAAHAFKGARPPEYAIGEHRAGPKLDQSYCLVVAGDTPNLSPRLLREFISHSIANDFDISVCGMEPEDPSGYGRLVLTPTGSLSAIVEEKDASDEIKQIRLCNSGVIFAKRQVLFSTLGKLDNQNEQKEYYLTDCIRIGNARQLSIGSFRSPAWEYFLGINTPDQLAFLETMMLSPEQGTDTLP